MFSSSNVQGAGVLKKNSGASKIGTSTGQTVEDELNSRASKVNSGNVLEAGRANNLLVRHASSGNAARMHIEPNGYVDSGTTSKLDLMFDPYEDDPVNYRILNLYCKNGNGNGLNGENGAAVLNVKGTGDAWGVWPSLHFAFNDDGSTGVPMKMYLFDTSDSQWRTPMTGHWRQGKSINTGDYALNDFKLYQATTTGTTGSTAPTHTSSTASDGGVTWQFIRNYQSSAASIKPCVLIGDRDTMPKFGFGNARLQIAGDVIYHWGYNSKFLRDDNSELADIYQSTSSGQYFLNLAINGGGNLRISDDNYYQAVGLARRLDPDSYTGGETSVDVSSTELVVFGNGSPTTVANFTNGQPYQVIKVQSSNGQTTIAHNANIRLAGGSNLTLTADDCIEFVSDGAGTVWKQVR